MKGLLEVVCPGAETLKFELGDNHKVILGRTDESDWSVPDEKFLSRRHVQLHFKAGHLHVKRLTGTTNPVFHQGQEKDAFFLESGDQFVIGKTRFHFTAYMRRDDPKPDLKLSMSQEEVYQQDGVSDRIRILDLLELPEILRNKSQDESLVHIASLLRSVTGAVWAQILNPRGKILSTDSAMDGMDFKTSRTLIDEALKHSPQPFLYSWASAQQSISATIQEGTDWAVCVASQIAGDEPLLFYVSGQGGTEQMMKDNCRLVGLIADMVGRSLNVHRLEGLKERLQRFFSGQVVSKILESSDSQDMKPKLTEGTVMFFDIRGFSKITEGKTEKILEKADQLQEVMSGMTEEIFKENGVVLQFLGDGILACWNLPFPDPEHINRSCKAALGMVTALERIAPHWRCGIGLHTGEVVAGSMGAKQLFSYTVMGPVVNQASRLEGITKIVEVPILVTKEIVEKISPEVASTRRLGRFRPAGMTVALDLYEVRHLPANTENDERFEKGLAHFEAGEWEEAYEVLDHLPPSDRPGRYIKNLSESHRRRPPKDWQGIIELSEK